MKLTLADYDASQADEIAAWLRDADTLRFAFDGPWAEEYRQFLAGEEYRRGEARCMVALDDGEPVALMMLYNRSGGPLVINPIVVNPRLRRRGVAAAVLREVIGRADTLFSPPVGSIEAGVALGNAACRRALEKCGFALKGLHPDGDFAYYEYRLR